MALLTADEVAAILRVDRRTVYAMTSRGELPAIRVGRGLRYRRTDVEAFLGTAASA